MQPCPLAKAGVAERKGARTGRGISQAAHAAIFGTEAWGNPVGRRSFTLVRREGLAP